MKMRSALLAVAVAWAVAAWAADPAGPVPVKLVHRGAKWQLLRAGKPYFIRGAGGGGPKEMLARCGGNSFRTWGVGADTQRDLDEAQRDGLTVALGCWLGHKDQGFHYDDPRAVARQAQNVRRAVLKYKDHPALLLWSLGNEMEMKNDTPELWRAVQELAKMVHQLDPHHPTMTVVAEIGGHKVQNIHKYCPDIDVIGINSYGGGASLAERYRKAGGTKPFVVTEFGPPGTWESRKNAFGAAPELTSTQKARCYRETYEKSVLGEPALCLGSYAFTWGWKVEATATWFGMLLPDHSRLAAVDTMQELWTGVKPADPCPVMERLALTSKDQVARGEKVRAVVEARDPQGAALKIQWTLLGEQASYSAQGLGADATGSFADAIAQNGRPTVTVTMPKSGGVYRLYCVVRNGRGGAAVGSLPIKVAGPASPLKPAVARLPLVLLGGDATKRPYIPSGWMGNVKAIRMDADCTENPRAGKTCMKFTYEDPAGWGGVVWQDPANDWGDKPGGYDLSAARQLSFWARGREGGEKVKFGYGILGTDKKYHDSSKAQRELTLTSKWQQYTFDLGEKDLSRIKSGFLWSLAGQGKPVTFYLDDIRYK